MRKPIQLLWILPMVAILGLAVSTAAQERQTPSSEEEITAALTGGVPMGRWKEGVLFEGVRPMPWLKSAAIWFPCTEDIQPN